MHFTEPIIMGSLGLEPQLRQRRLAALRNAAVAFVHSMLETDQPWLIPEDPEREAEVAHLLRSFEEQIGVSLGGRVALKRFPDGGIRSDWRLVFECLSETPSVDPKYDCGIVRDLNATQVYGLKITAVSSVSRSDAEELILNRPTFCEFTMDDDSRVRIEGGAWTALPPAATRKNETDPEWLDSK